MNMFLSVALTIRTVYKTLRAVIGIAAIAATVSRWVTGRKKDQSFRPAAARQV